MIAQKPVTLSDAPFSDTELKLANSAVQRKCVRYVKPDYPVNALRNAVEGIMIVRVIIAPDGRISDAAFVKMQKFKRAPYNKKCAATPYFTDDQLISELAVAAQNGLKNSVVESADQPMILDVKVECAIK